MTDTKPREFWIYDNGFTEKPVDDEPPEPEDHRKYLHVIEHSAYQAEVDAHKATINLLKDALEDHHYNICEGSCTVWCMNVQKHLDKIGDVS